MIGAQSGNSLSVCLFADSFLPKIGGMELAIHHLANALCAHGCKVTIIAKYFKGPFPWEKKYTLKQYGNRFPGSGRVGADSISAIVTLMAAHYKSCFNIVNCHSASYAGSRIFLAGKLRLLKLPVVMTPHGEDIQIVPELGYGLRLGRKWDTIIKRNIISANCVTAISETVKDQLLFVVGNKIHNIPNGITMSDFQVGDHRFLYQRLSIPTEDKIVLSVGRQRPVKGYQYGIHAFAHLHRRNTGKGLRYVIIGKDTHTLRPLVKSLNLTEVVYLLPQMDYKQLISAYHSAWCFLSPSLSEGLSLVSIEAIACGLPLVVTDVPGNADIIRDNGCGMVVQPKDPQAIARGLLILLNNPDIYNRYATKATTAARRYDWSIIARKYIDVYHQTIDQHRALVKRA